MKFLSQWPVRDRGQTLILVAVAFLVLVGFVALAVDAGNLYANRRDMQNAADAAALSGARALCAHWNSPGTREAEARAAAQTFGAANGAANVDVSFPISNVVAVVADTQVSSFLAGLPPIGVTNSTVSAQAAARCGEARGGCDIWPIGLEKPMWDSVPKTCGTEFIVLDTDKVCGTAVGNLVCQSNTVTYSPGGNRGWLRLPNPDPTKYPSVPCGGDCGNNSVMCWLQPENSYPEEVPLPICIKAKPGTMSSAFEEAGQPGNIGRVVKIPVYDSFVKSSTCPGGAPILGDKCPDQYLMHVVEIACVEIVSMEKNKEFQVVDTDGKFKKEKITVLNVRVSCSPLCAQSCTGAAPSGPGIGDASAVSLIQ